MKIRIDQNGLLGIERAGKMKEQFCPFSAELLWSCGDHCPHFGEICQNAPIKGMSSLTLCHGTELRGEIGDFADARENTRPAAAAEKAT